MSALLSIFLLFGLRISHWIEGIDDGFLQSTMSAGQSAFGNPWSVYEDRALVVLVHDVGPNWELVSDAINSTLQFKCIFRKPKEYKERHKELMDRNDDDGADSAEDSGSSQHYPSTLPGIPKGSARQLLQHLHGPIEEDTLKGHFEKIIRLGQLLHSRRSQATSQRLSVGMTPKNIRLPNHGEMLLSVHGSPLGVYGEDNMEAIHESEEG
ncbi:hypothetical protein AAC387_Pa05g0466 [Persea americana]